MNKSLKFRHLENFDFFSELNQNQHEFVHSNTEMKRLLKNEIIYLEGSPANNIYFLKEGEVRISKFNDAGEEFLIRIIPPGSIFGESSIIFSSKRKEFATAEKQSLICRISNNKMKELLLLNPELNLKFSEMLEIRLESMQKRLEDLTFKNSEERILDFLKTTAKNSGKCSNGEIIIPSSLTHKNIAKLASTSRQVVSGVFNDLKKNGIIDYNRREIRILNPDAILNSSSKTVK